VTRDGVGAGNRLGVEGAKALAPVLATLTQLNLLSLEGACRILMHFIFPFLELITFGHAHAVSHAVSPVQLIHVACVDVLL